MFSDSARCRDDKRGSNSLKDFGRFFVTISNLLSLSTLDVAASEIVSMEQAPHNIFTHAGSRDKKQPQALNKILS